MQRNARNASKHQKWQIFIIYLNAQVLLNAIHRKRCEEGNTPYFDDRRVCNVQRQSYTMDLT